MSQVPASRPVVPEVKQAIPILRIFDLARAREFYLDYLGFTVDWEHRFEPDTPVYMQVSLGGVVLHLSEHHGDACPGSTVFVRVRGLREFHAGLSAKGYRYMRPGVVPTPWGSLGMEVTDPFGNRLRFDEPLPREQR
jgi:catechol 2,3-dioxygenase-like lactoylglutathione lyase family enzyme